MIRKLVILATVMVCMCAAEVWALEFNKTITAIYGGGNPDSGWTAEMEIDSGIILAMRAKDRDTSSTLNVEGVYTFSTGYAVGSSTRARWNWDFSINSGTVNLDAYDFYVGMDTDPSKDVNFNVVNALTFWTDSSYGNNSTLNGQGVEGTALQYASVYNIVQQSQNITFYGQNPNANATYDYVLYAVAKGAGPNGLKIASVGITVIVGTGGAAFLDTDGDGVKDSLDQCPSTPAGVAVNSHGCSIQEILNICAVSPVTHGEYVSCVADAVNQMASEGLITNKQRQEYIVKAAKSSIGN